MTFDLTSFIRVRKRHTILWIWLKTRLRCLNDFKRRAFWQRHGNFRWYRLRYVWRPKSDVFRIWRIIITIRRIIWTTEQESFWDTKLYRLVRRSRKRFWGIWRRRFWWRFFRWVSVYRLWSSCSAPKPGDGQHALCATYRERYHHQPKCALSKHHIPSAVSEFLL